MNSTFFNINSLVNSIKNMSLKKQTSINHNEQQIEHNEMISTAKAYREQESIQIIMEQNAAQIAALSCEISANALAVGLSNAVKLLRKKRRKNSLTHYTYVKRKVIKEEDSLIDRIEASGKLSYSLVNDESNAYIRNYNYNNYNSFMKSIADSTINFQRLEIIDFSNQLLGDDRISDLCKSVIRSPIRILNLSTNNISDDGLLCLSKILRSLYYLENLYLANNDFTDKGMRFLCDKDCYSPSIRLLDLRQNVLTNESAYFIGLLFNKNYKSNLNALLLGGKRNNNINGWGDSFLYVLLGLLMLPTSRPLHQLSISDFNITSNGFNTISTYLIYNNSLKWLNISRNLFTDEITKKFFSLALLYNTSLNDLLLGYNNITNIEKLNFSNCKNKNCKILLWDEKLFLCLYIAKEMLECSKNIYTIELSIFNSWNIDIPESVRYIISSINRLPIKPLLSTHIFNKSPIYIQNLIISCEIFTKFYIALNIYIKDLLILKENIEKENNVTKSTVNQVNISRIYKYVQLNTQRYINSQTIMRLITNRYVGYLDVVQSLSSHNVNRFATNDSLDIESSTHHRHHNKQLNKWTNQFNSLNVELVYMSIEDFRSSQIEICEITEMYIGELYFACLLMDKSQENTVKLLGNEINIKVIPNEMINKRGSINNNINDNKKRQSIINLNQTNKQSNSIINVNTIDATNKINQIIPHYSKLGIASIFVHYVYVHHPSQMEKQKRSIKVIERELRTKTNAEIKRQMRMRKKSVIIPGPKLKVIGTPKSNHVIFDSSVSSKEEKKIDNQIISKLDNKIDSPMIKSPTTDKSSKKRFFIDSNKILESFKLSYKKEAQLTDLSNISTNNQLDIQSIDNTSLNDSDNNSISTVNNSYKSKKSKYMTKYVTNKSNTNGELLLPKLNKSIKIVDIQNQLIENFNSFQLIDLYDQVCVYNYSRGSRRYAVGCYNEYLAYGQHIQVVSKYYDVSNRRNALYLNISTINEVNEKINSNIHQLSRSSSNHSTFSLTNRNSSPLNKSMNRLDSNSSRLTNNTMQTTTAIDKVLITEEEIFRCQTITNIKCLNVSRNNIRNQLKSFEKTEYNLIKKENELFI